MQWLTETVGGTAATPAPLPSASDLAALDPAVAIALLVASVVIALLVYVGPSLRDRLRPPTPAPQPAAPPVAPMSHGAHAAVDQAEVRTERFIDHLLRQIQDGTEREDELEDRLRAKDVEHEARLRARDEQVAQLEREVRRLESLLWQRGNR